MKKIVIENTHLTVFTQTATTLPSTPTQGTLSMKADGPEFVQTVSRPRSAPNPKLFDGKYMSLVQSRDGQLVPYTKCPNLMDEADLAMFQTRFVMELMEVVRLVDDMKRKA